MKQNPTGRSSSLSKRETEIENFSGKKKEIFLLAFLFLILFSLNYNFLDSKLQIFLGNAEIRVGVERIIDGDTFKIENGTIRMLGINTPEKKEKYYSEAKNFLENEIFNETVNLEFGREKEDLYGRTLAYVFFENENVNLKLVENGLANFYFPSGKDKRYNEFKTAWENCIKENRNLCEKSQEKCAECIELNEFNAKEQKTTFYNSCNFSCEIAGWEIKDEGRKKFIFPQFVLESGKQISIIVGNETNNNENLFWKNEEYVWTKSGDTLFLRDSEGKLVLWENY